jgi:hypothetical protein
MVWDGNDTVWGRVVVEFPVVFNGLLSSAMCSLISFWGQLLAELIFNMWCYCGSHLLSFLLMYHYCHQSSSFSLFIIDAFDVSLTHTRNSNAEKCIIILNQICIQRTSFLFTSMPPSLWKFQDSWLLESLGWFGLECASSTSNLLGGGPGYAFWY